MKRCSKCGGEFPLDHFAKNAHGPMGRAWECKACGRAYRERTRAARLAHQAEYRGANRERLLADSRARYSRDLDRSRALNREKRARAPERYREIAQRFDERHPTARRELGRKWAATPRGRAVVLEATRRSRAKNRQHYNDLTRGYRNRKRGAGGRFTPAEWAALCARFGNVCLACGAPGPLTADHVLPLLLGGANTIDNIQPLCQSCNSRKGTSTTDYRPKDNPRVEVAVWTVAPAHVQETLL